MLDLRARDDAKRRQLAAKLYDCIGRVMADFVTRGVSAAKPTFRAATDEHVSMGGVLRRDALAARGGIRQGRTAPSCTVPQETTHFTVGLPNTAAIRSGKALVVVAIGSSSTKESAPQYGPDYPALLTEDLRRRWPAGGDRNQQGCQRRDCLPDAGALRGDVLPYHPQLVIWQTGTNQALRTGDIGGCVDTIRRASAVSRRQGRTSY